MTTDAARYFCDEHQKLLSESQVEKFVCFWCAQNKIAEREVEAATAALEQVAQKIRERRDYFASKDLHNGWSGKESGSCCNKCEMKPEHFTGRADALKAAVGCRNPFQLSEVCQCHIPVRESVKTGIVEAHNQLLTLIATIGDDNEHGNQD